MVGIKNSWFSLSQDGLRYLIYLLLLGMLLFAQLTLNPLFIREVLANEAMPSKSINDVTSLQKCFVSPKQAYQFLLAEEQRQQDKIVNRPININTATEAELISLKGIGSKKAQAIILYRETFGRFKNVDDLIKVKGIGQKTVDKNRHRLQVLH